MLRAAGVAIFLAFYVLLIGPPFILHCLVTGSVDLLYRVGVRGGWLALRLAGVEVRVEGRENIPAGTCLFVANHTSNADPPTMLSAIPRRVSLLAKKEVFRVPILSTVLRLGQIVRVDRADREAAIESVEKAIELLRAGLSFLIFPEGTRSPDGRLAAFKRGPFVMAIRAGVHVVPVSVVGAHKIMRKGEFAIHPGEIVVHFHRPVDASSYTLDQRQELIARVESIIAAALPPEQRPREAVGASPPHPEPNIET